MTSPTDRQSEPEADVVAALRELAFNLALVLIGEVVHRVAGLDRLWALVAALVVGHLVRAAARARKRRSVRPRTRGGRTAR